MIHPIYNVIRILKYKNTPRKLNIRKHFIYNEFLKLKFKNILIKNTKKKFTAIGSFFFL